MCNIEIPVITGGTLRSLGIVRPKSSDIIRLATDAVLNGFGLSGDGPIRRVTGSKLTIVVGPTGCSCPIWRSGEFCHHAALYIVETGMVSLPPATVNLAYRASSPRRSLRRPRRQHQTFERIAHAHDQHHRRWPVRAAVITASDNDTDRAA